MKRKVLCCKKPTKIWDVNVENIDISKLVNWIFRKSYDH